jgi:hypothetical protein
VDGDLYFYGLLLKNVPATSEADLLEGVVVDTGPWRYREACYRKKLIGHDERIVEELEDEYAKKSYTTAASSNGVDKVWDLIDKVNEGRVAAGDFDVDEDGFFSWQLHLTADHGVSAADDAAFDMECAMLSKATV